MYRCDAGEDEAAMARLMLHLSTCW